MKLHTVEVRVHQPVNEGFRVKVSVLSLGMYLNGVLVFPPNDKHEDWIVYPPSINTRFKRIYPAEFNKKMDLWLEIHQACVDAVMLYQADEEAVTDIDIDQTPEELDKSLGEAIDKLGLSDG